MKYAALPPLAVVAPSMAGDRHKGLDAGFPMALVDSGVLALPDGRWYLSAAHGAGIAAETPRRIEAL